MAEKKDICTVDRVKTVSSGDSVLMNIDGGVCQVSVEDFMKSAEPAKVASLEELDANEDLDGVYLGVVDTQGEQKKVALSRLPKTEYDENVYAYGVSQENYLLGNPELTRIGNLALHKTLPVQSLMRGCLLDDNGNVIEYLPASSWEGAVRDGSRGQVMVEIPAHYEKWKRIGTETQWWMSLYPIKGYRYYPKMYVSAYQAALDRENMKLASVVNTTEQYRGGNNSADWGDNNEFTLLGRPVTSLSLSELRQCARNRKAGSTNWNIMTYDVYRTLYIMFIVEYATLNMSKNVNDALTAEGYRQGGLGVMGYSGGTPYMFRRLPFIPCGVTDSLGNDSGVVEYAFPEEIVTATGISSSIAVNRYRGIELIIGHIKILCDGIHLFIDEMTANGGSGRRSAYVCSNPAKFSDDSLDGYRYVCEFGAKDSYNNGNVSGLVFSIAGGEYNDIISIYSPEIEKDYHGSGSYFCGTYNIYCREGVNNILIGGYTDSLSSNKDKLLYLELGDAGSEVGSRLCYIPRVVE